jgi:surface antigen
MSWTDRIRAHRAPAFGCAMLLALGPAAGQAASLKPLYEPAPAFTLVDDDDDDDHGHRHKHKHHHHHHKHHKPKVVHHHHHYYGTPRDAGYHVPYGFDRGTCDRGLITSEIIGGVVGGAIGGLAGSQIGKGRGKIVATAGGTLIGVLLGTSVGRSMDDADQECFGQALEHAPDRRPIVWENEAGHGYEMVPVRSYQAHSGAYCREYQTVATIGGQRQQAYGVACRQPDGAWKIVSAR